MCRRCFLPYVPEKESNHLFGKLSSFTDFDHTSRVHKSKMNTRASKKETQSWINDIVFKYEHIHRSFECKIKTESWTYHDLESEDHMLYVWARSTYQILRTFHFSGFRTNEKNNDGVITSHRRWKLFYHSIIWNHIICANIISNSTMIDSRSDTSGVAVTSHTRSVPNSQKDRTTKKRYSLGSTASSNVYTCFCWIQSISSTISMQLVDWILIVSFLLWTYHV